MVQGTLRLARIGNQRRPVPENFCLDTNRDEMLSFFWNFRRLMSLPVRGRLLPKNVGARVPKIWSYYDFAAIKKITPAAALVFASEFDRIRRVFDRPLYAVDLHKWNPEVVRTLRDIGFFSLLGIEAPCSERPNDQIVVFRFRSNTKVVSEEIGGEGSSLLGDLFAAIEGNQSLRLNLYTAVLEAMQNVIDHAYVDRFFHGIRHVKAWWLGAAADRLNRELTVTLYDQGITIPVSLPFRQGTPLLGDALRKLFGLDYDPEDTKYDAAARCGLYEVQSGGKVSTEVLQVPLGGTLIEIRAAF